MKVITFMLISLSFIANCFAFDFEKEFGNVEVKTQIIDNQTNDFARYLRAEFEKYKRKDKLYLQLQEVSEKALKAIETCRDDFLKANNNVSRLVSIRVCHDLINLSFPSSNYNPTTGGFIKLGNYVVYLTDIETNQVTKIDYIGEISMSAMKQTDYTYIVNVEMNKNNIQFVLNDERILDILNVSIAYDIERAFLSKNQKVSVKQIVSNLLDYYNYLKKQNIYLSSLDFVIDILSSIQSQQKFVDFVLRNQGVEK